MKLEKSYDRIKSLVTFFFVNLFIFFGLVQTASIPISDAVMLTNCLEKNKVCFFFKELFLFKYFNIIETARNVKFSISLDGKLKYEKTISFINFERTKYKNENNIYISWFPFTIGSNTEFEKVTKLFLSEGEVKYHLNFTHAGTPFEYMPITYNSVKSYDIAPFKIKTGLSYDIDSIKIPTIKDIVAGVVFSVDSYGILTHIENEYFAFLCVGKIFIREFFKQYNQESFVILVFDSNGILYTVPVEIQQVI
jgi:hypothetical protein